MLSNQLAVASGRAQEPSDGWLADPLVPWNYAGMPIPAAEADFSEFIDPICARSVRQPEIPEDWLVAERGWNLFGPYEGGWGLRYFGATAGFDGMCRPYGYQYFFFLDGVFVGTIAPGSMASRTTGAGRVLSFDADRRVVTTYVRYAPEDPLCCPSRPALSIELRVRITDEGPVLLPERVFEFN
jgi:hypothetical protein